MLCAISQSARIEKADFLRNQLEADLFLGTKFPIQVHRRGGLAPNSHRLALKMTDKVGKSAVFSPLIVANDGRNSQTGDRRNQQNIQETIVWFCIWNRVKSAAVVPAVAHTDHGQWRFKPPTIQLHSIGRMDATQNIDQNGEHIGTGTGQKWAAVYSG